jgi:folate-dependent phosphoribosylglycinamide formyltransferase PurN
LPDARVLLLASPGASTDIVAHALAAEHALTVVVEERVSRLQLLRGRYRKLGPWPVAGQLAFIAVAQPLLARAAARRIDALKRRHALDDSPFPVDHRVPSVNSPEARALLHQLAPSVIVVNGTRIISRETLACVSAPFLNMHAGITPRYRGVHGGYWALAERRPDLVGTTVHVVDAGIDTGAVVEQVRFTVEPEDSFATYPYLHLAAGLPALARAVRAALVGELPRRPPLADGSRLHYHPTLWGYLRARLVENVK